MRHLSFLSPVRLVRRRVSASVSLWDERDVGELGYTARQLTYVHNDSAEHLLAELGSDKLAHV